MKDIYSPLEIDEEWDNFAPDTATATAEAPAPLAPGTKIEVQGSDPDKNPLGGGKPGALPDIIGDPPDTFQPIQINGPETNVNSTGAEPDTSMVGLNKQEDGSYQPVVQDNILPNEDPAPPRVAAGGSPPPDGPGGYPNALPAEPNTKQPIDTTGGIVDPGNNMDSAMGTVAAKEEPVDEARKAAEENMKKWMARDNGSIGGDDTLNIEDTGAEIGVNANNMQPGQENQRDDGKDQVEVMPENGEDDDGVKPVQIKVPANEDASTVADENVQDEENNKPGGDDKNNVGWENEEEDGEKAEPAPTEVDEAKAAYVRSLENSIRKEQATKKGMEADRAEAQDKVNSLDQDIANSDDLIKKYQAELDKLNS